MAPAATHSPCSYYSRLSPCGMFSLSTAATPNRPINHIVLSPRRAPSILSPPPLSSSSPPPAPPHAYCVAPIGRRGSLGRPSRSGNSSVMGISRLLFLGAGDWENEALLQTCQSSRFLARASRSLLLPATR